MLQSRINFPHHVSGKGRSISSHHSHFQPSYKCFSLTSAQDLHSGMVEPTNVLTT